MVLTTDIGHLVSPIERISNRASFTTKFLSFVEHFNEWAINSLLNELDMSILKLEGMAVRIERLSPETMVGLVKSSADAIDNFDKIANAIASNYYFGNNDIKEKVKYTQKCLYRLDAQIHRKIHRASKAIPTDQKLKDQLSKLNIVYSS